MNNARRQAVHSNKMFRQTAKEPKVPRGTARNAARKGKQADYVPSGLD